MRTLIHRVAKAEDERARIMAALAGATELLESAESVQWSGFQKWVADAMDRAYRALASADSLHEIGKLQGKVEILRGLADMKTLMQNEVQRLTAEAERLDAATKHMRSFEMRATP